MIINEPEILAEVTAAFREFLPEILQVPLIDSTLQKCPCVNSRNRMPLKINQVARKIRRPRPQNPG